MPQWKLYCIICWPSIEAVELKNELALKSLCDFRTDILRCICVCCKRKDSARKQAQLVFDQSEPSQSSPDHVRTGSLAIAQLFSPMKKQIKPQLFSPISQEVDKTAGCSIFFTMALNSVFGIFIFQFVWVPSKYKLKKPQPQNLESKSKSNHSIMFFNKVFKKNISPAIFGKYFLNIRYTHSAVQRVLEKYSTFTGKYILISNEEYYIFIEKYSKIRTLQSTFSTSKRNIHIHK